MSHFEPGEYPCKWFIARSGGRIDEFPGELSLRADAPPRGHFHGQMPIEYKRSPDGNSSTAAYPQHESVSELRVRLVMGVYALLIDAEITFWFDDQATVTAAAAICPFDAQVGETDWDQFQASAFQVTGIEALAGVTPLARYTRPDDPRQSDGVWSAQRNPASALEWAGPEVVVRVKYDMSATVFDAYAFSLRFYPMIRVECTKPLSLRDWIDQWLRPVQRIVSVTTGGHSKVTCFALRKSVDERASTSGQVFGTGIFQEKRASDQNTVRESPSSLSLSKHNISLLQLAQRWRALELNRNPLIETYGPMLGVTHDHPRSRVLLLLQAIEGHYGHENRSHADAQRSDHDRRRLEVIEAAQQSLDQPQLRFLKKNLSKRPHDGIENALRYVVERLPEAARTELDRVPILSDVKRDDDLDSEIAALRVIRNNLAHGNKSYPTDELAALAEVLKRIVRATVLKLLGCPTAVLDATLNPTG